MLCNESAYQTNKRKRMNIFCLSSTLASISSKISLGKNHAKSSTRSCRGGNADHVDYAIKALEELICITEGKQHQIAMGLHRMLCNVRATTKPTKGAFGKDYDYLY
ncbi:hypothetical protein RhiirC2_368208 [Rhizophagus irregularis]|uniref:Uncharacterized protein n=1 Tax=Rhizophagus irregularis TaxID=588596 RepID=A0A2N1NG47_9GLOM|nr:hypothetical protein RhiirC2_368208 [Rhizophagus irregularis]